MQALVQPIMLVLALFVHFHVHVFVLQALSSLYDSLLILALDKHSLCRRVLDLEVELAHAKEMAAQREAEMHETIESLRQAKKDLEAQAAGVDLTAMQQGDELVQQVRTVLASLE
jgi:hypothetical protein